MVSTYPELKNAFNNCRNPGGAGKRPWCFTSDKNKRWEYCYIGTDCSKSKKNIVRIDLVRIMQFLHVTH